MIGFLRLFTMQRESVPNHNEKGPTTGGCVLNAVRESLCRAPGASFPSRSLKVKATTCQSK
eukprot:488193-Amphidinium_carterae.1